MIDSVANDLGVLRTHINIAWVLAHQHLTTALAGAESTQHIEDNIQGANITIPTNLLTKLNDASNTYKKKWCLEGKFVVLYSGNLGRFHDLETIMKAAKKLNQIEL